MRSTDKSRRESPKEYSAHDKEAAQRRWAAKKLRARLSAVPFYREKSAKWRENHAGNDDISYWLNLLPKDFSSYDY